MGVLYTVRSPILLVVVCIRTVKAANRVPASFRRELHLASEVARVVSRITRAVIQRGDVKLVSPLPDERVFFDAELPGDDFKCHTGYAAISQFCDDALAFGTPVNWLANGVTVRNWPRKRRNHPTCVSARVVDNWQYSDFAVATIIASRVRLVASVSLAFLKVFH